MGIIRGARGRLRTVAALSALFTLASVASASAQDPGYSLRADADRAGISFGSAAQFWWVPSGPYPDIAYVDLLDRHANTITFENEVKWRTVHPAQDTYEFSYADMLATWAQAHGMHMRGHTLLWFSRLPDWLKALDPTREEAIAIMRDHIYTVVGHFRDEFPGLVTEWDVVNEEMDNDGTVRNGYWRQQIGDDFVDLAFRFAREAAGPKVDLYYNDYFDDGAMEGAENAGGDADDGDPVPMTTPGAEGALSCAQVIKCTAVRALVTGLLARGVPIDGVGFQAHMVGPTPSDYRALTDWVGDLGLEWALTEMDRPIHFVNDTTHQEQATALATAAQSCVDDPACNTIVTWGLADRYTWWKSASGGYYVDALPFGENLEAKLASDALHEALSNAPPLPPPSAGGGVAAAPQPTVTMPKKKCKKRRGKSAVAAKCKKGKR